MYPRSQSVLIVDDEPASRAQLRDIIDTLPDLSITDEVSNGQAAICAIREHHPDIVFLDIDMPTVDGFGVAQATEDLNYQLIFVTAHHKYALEAFNTNAIDFLLKPVRPSSLKKCLAKIERQKELTLERLSPQKTDSQCVVLTDGGVSRVISYDHILYIEGLGRYRRVHLSSPGRDKHNLATVLSDTTLDEFIDQLQSGPFMRIHRSFIVNVKKIVALRSKDRRYHLCIDEIPEEIPVARTQVKRLKKRMDGVIA
jgi:DNA-binding LytR/AlgR family response regulator